MGLPVSPALFQPYPTPKKMGVPPHPKAQPWESLCSGRDEQQQMGSGSPRREMSHRDHTAGGKRTRTRTLLPEFPEESPRRTSPPLPAAPPSSFTHLLSKLGTIHVLQTRSGKPRPLKYTHTQHAYTHARTYTCTRTHAPPRPWLSREGGRPPTLRHSELPWLGLNRQKEMQR